jgi:hypothetical protein
MTQFDRTCGGCRGPSLLLPIPRRRKGEGSRPATKWVLCSRPLVQFRNARKSAAIRAVAVPREDRYPEQLLSRSPSRLVPDCELRDQAACSNK